MLFKRETVIRQDYRKKPGIPGGSQGCIWEAPNIPDRSSVVALPEKKGHRGITLAAALRTKGGAGSTSVQVLPGTGRKMSTFRTSAAFLVMIVRNKEAVSADFFGDSRGVFGKSPCHL